MRPLSLTLDGFTSYKRHEEVPFADLELFAICGPTGAGKTSLLDGIVFALYGKVPRLRAGYTDLITQGFSQMAVTLSFRLGGIEYRVSRRAYTTKGRSAVAVLEEHKNGEVRILAEGMPDVTARIERLLGLPYDAFTQAVLLPQGKFAEFLQSRAGDRTKLLRNILGYSIYDYMQKQAEQRRRDLATRIEVLEQTLASEYAGATPEALTERRTAIAAAERTLAEAEAAAKTARQIATDTEQRFRHGTELAAAERTLADLRRQETAKGADRARLSAAERAQPVLPVLSRVKDVEQLVEQQRATLRTAAAAVTAAERDDKRATETLKRAETAASELQAMKDRIRNLDSVKGLLDARTEKQRALNSAEKRRSTAADRLARDRKEAAALDEQLSDLKAAVREAEQELADLAYDERIDQRLEQAKPTAVTLKTLRQAASDADAEADDAERDARTAATAQSKADEALQAAERPRDEAKAKLAAVEADLEAARDEHAAAHLRQWLKVGEVCPVCDQSVGKRPPRLVVSALDALSGKRDTAIAKLEAVEKKRATAAADAAKASAAASKAVRDAAKARDRATAKAKELADTERALTAVLKGITLPARGALEARVVDAADEMAMRRRRHAKGQAAVAEARKQYEKALDRHETLGKSITEYADQEKAAADEVKQLTGELRDLTRDIRKITTHPDPAAERDDVARRVETIESGWRDARSAASAAQATLKGVRNQHAAAEKELGAREQRAAGLREQAGKAATEAGFSTWETAARAELPTSEITALRARIKEYDDQRTRITRRIEELSAVLGGATINERQLRGVQEAATRAGDAAGAAAKAVGALQQEIEQLRKRLDKAKELQGELGRLRGDFAIYRRLADDLRASGGGFQAFMLEEAFTDIASAASERLLALTHNRYGLRYAGEGTILVVDHDNAGQERGTDTLSGGETFLTSLALALELSEQVRSRHYGVSLDSLFIDEGFSTLDPDTLESAAEAITAIGQSGRMVGIITHLPELAAQLPSRIEVDRRPDGSHARVVSA